MAAKMTNTQVSNERRVDRLELFFDLVFVVVIKQLTGLLHGDPALNEFLTVAGHSLRSRRHKHARPRRRLHHMPVTCVIDYTIDPRKTADFEKFAERWMQLVEQNGGEHHGYFLPSDGASDKALALFTFESLATYEIYRAKFGVDPEFIAADLVRDESGCVVRFERTFMRPLLPPRGARVSTVGID